MTRPAVEIIQADFAETLRRVADAGGADLILTSPPYPGVARTYGQEGEAAVWDLARYQRLGDFVKLALKPGGHCLMVLDAPVREWRKGYGTERGFLPWQVMLDWAERVGLRVPDRLAYGRFGAPGNFGPRFRNDWEPLLWFQRSGAGGFFDSVPLREKAVTRVAIRFHGGRSANGENHSGKSRKEAGEHTTRERSTLWWYGAPGGGEFSSFKHPAPYMLEFAEDAVRCFCPPDGLVCDPFSGSGTTAAAALIHGRRFFGGDLLNRPSDGRSWADIGTERARRALIKARLKAAIGE